MSQDRTRNEFRDYNDEFDLDPEEQQQAREPEFWGPNENAEPEAATKSTIGAAHVPEHEPRTDQTCVMLGPSKSGKTTLLTAIKRACDQPADDALNLEFIPREETATKIKIAVENIVERKKGHAATPDVKNYPFEIHVSAKQPSFWSPPLEADLHVVMSDGGGEFLLPTDVLTEDQKVFRQQLIETALGAASMILCVDVSMPSTTTLEKELAISFAKISRPTPIPSTIHWSVKLSAWIRRRPVPKPRERLKECLNVDRFLLLLTQVDKLCHQLPSSIERTIRFAEMLDPVEQARELLGVPILKTIRSALKPSTSFAVGVISAMGFHPITGDPFADVDGTPLNLDSETGEDILRRWTPFGIRDAIYFLATGKCRGRVKELRASDLDLGTEPLEFSYGTPFQKEA